MICSRTLSNSSVLAAGADTTATDGVVKTIIACTDILRRTGKLAA